MAFHTSRNFERRKLSSKDWSERAEPQVSPTKLACLLQVTALLQIPADRCVLKLSYRFQP